ncbi:hypothetical protein [Arthrobacter sp. PAMC 25486]|uniref:hypothetical protein n=1 Tax=Arthrobacter sp. PAMC 25486 TaxID=1494608 RepID=UPI00056DFD81|nr:hypothetical protein [Arthrobacter sp. PAMC 25486]
MNQPVTFNLFFPFDEDGFLALVAPDHYSGFVAPDWTLAQLMDRFVEQMNLENAFVAYPGDDFADEPFHLVDQHGAGRVIREASGMLRVGDAGLRLTSYTQLTMAAQFPDEAAADPRNSLRLPCAPGVYRLSLREFSGVEPAFELEIRPADNAAPVIHDAVPWFGR